MGVWATRPTACMVTGQRTRCPPRGCGGGLTSAPPGPRRRVTPRSTPVANGGGCSLRLQTSGPGPRGEHQAAAVNAPCCSTHISPSLEWCHLHQPRKHFSRTEQTLPPSGSLSATQNPTQLSPLRWSGPALGQTLLRETERGQEGSFWAVGGLRFVVRVVVTQGTRKHSWELQMCTRHCKSHPSKYTWF